MEAAALAAEVFSTLKSVGLVGTVTVLCFLALAAWLSREAFRTGRSLQIKVKLRSLEIRIGSESVVKSDSQPKEGGKALTSAETKLSDKRVGSTRDY
jgi:hypothetical protein